MKRKASEISIPKEEVKEEEVEKKFRVKLVGLKVFTKTPNIITFCQRLPTPVIPEKVIHPRRSSFAFLTFKSLEDKLSFEKYYESTYGS